jgi:hypothetical protein
MNGWSGPSSFSSMNGWSGPSSFSSMNGWSGSSSTCSTQSNEGFRKFRMDLYGYNNIRVRTVTSVRIQQYPCTDFAYWHGSVVNLLRIRAIYYGYLNIRELAGRFLTLCALLRNVPFTYTYMVIYVYIFSCFSNFHGIRPSVGACYG